LAVKIPVLIAINAVEKRVGDLAPWSICEIAPPLLPIIIVDFPESG
jgi:hypothetical protein